MQVSLDHVGLSVPDLEASTAFYRRAFGFEREQAFELPEDIRAVMLAHPAGGRLELFERPGSTPGLQAANPIEAHATRGYSHLALSATDIAPLYEQALAAGARPIWSPRESPEPGVRFAYLADLDGNLIELVERRR